MKKHAVVLVFPLMIDGDHPEKLQQLMEDTNRVAMLDFDHRRQQARWVLTDVAQNKNEALTTCN